MIRDTSSVISDTIGIRVGNVDGADVATVIELLNNAKQRNIQTNENYNKRFVSKRKLYNYKVAANNDFRKLDVFIPLNIIISFCDEVDRLLGYIIFEIELTRSKDNSHCVYGAANTAAP